MKNNILTPFEEFMQRHADSDRVFLGPYSQYEITADPKHLLFRLARYKFCAKMFSDKEHILDVGCGECQFGIDIMLQSCKNITAIDIFKDIIKYNNTTNRHKERVAYHTHDIIQKPMPNTYDAAYSLDVIEHITPESESAFMQNISRSLKKDGVCIIGTPNITADVYASEVSRREHINLKSHESLKDLLATHFHNVFLFSMNDEVLHTGYYPMAHYLLAMAVSPRFT